MTFILDGRLEHDSHFVNDLGLCQLRLMDNRNFPWLILIPRVDDAVEWIDLSREEQHQLSDEIAIISHIFQALVTPDKLNIASFGNQVSQLHVHLIGRYHNDPAWPKPVWGGADAPYEAAELRKFLYEVKSAVNSVV